MRVALLFAFLAAFVQAEVKVPSASDLTKAGSMGITTITQLAAPANTTSAEKSAEKGAEKGALSRYTLIPTPGPNVLAAFFAVVLWLTIFTFGFSALFAVETPTKFVEKGLMMTKEY